jgi:hypothetical protein
MTDCYVGGVRSENMNAFQSAYAVAVANLEATRAVIAAECPMPKTDDDAVFEAWLDESAACESKHGLFAAERAVETTRDAMVRWSFEVAAAAARGPELDVVNEIAAKWPRLPYAAHNRVVDLAFRLSA